MIEAWSLNNIWDSTEVSFQRKLKENPIHPFVEVEDSKLLSTPKK